MPQFHLPKHILLSPGHPHHVEIVHVQCSLTGLQPPPITSEVHPYGCWSQNFHNYLDISSPLSPHPLIHLDSGI